MPLTSLRAAAIGAAFFVAVLGGGCSLISTDGTSYTPAQQLYALQNTYNAVLQTAANYATLPRCDDTDTAVCSEATVVARIQEADIAAWHAIAAAKTVVNDTDSTAEAVSAALLAVTSALTELQQHLTETETSE